MQTTNQPFRADAFVTAEQAAQLSAAHAAKLATQAAQIVKRRAEANRENAAKRVADKPTTGNRAQRRAAASNKPTPTPTQPVAAKPSVEARQRAQADANDARRLARDVAAKAVAAFYPGASLPFKAATDRFADYNPANGKSATARQAGLMLALITYGAGNMRSDGTFTRGAFTVPARLVNPNAKPNETVRAQPESGCLCNAIGRAVDYVSGPKSGREQASAVYRLRVNVALAEIQATFGDKPTQAARKLLASFDKRAA
jgi:hypothetical protein